MLLEVKDLWVHHGRAPALKGVTLAVSEGSLVALVGPNGAGKSTLVRTISGLKRASAGEILFDGKRIDRVPAHQDRRPGNRARTGGAPRLPGHDRVREFADGRLSEAAPG